MQDSFVKQARLGEMKQRDYQLEAARARRLRHAVREAPGHDLRWQLAEQLLRLAVRLSPSHRILLRAALPGRHS